MSVTVTVAPALKMRLIRINIRQKIGREKMKCIKSIKKLTSGQVRPRVGNGSCTGQRTNWLVTDAAASKYLIHWTLQMAEIR